MQFLEVPFIYQEADITSETKYKRRDRSSEIEPAQSSIAIETIIEELHSIESGESNFDIFVKHYKSLNNIVLLSDIVRDLIELSLGRNTMDDLVSFDSLLSLLGYDKERSVRLLQYKGAAGVTTIKSNSSSSETINYEGDSL